MCLKITAFASVLLFAQLVCADLNPIGGYSLYAQGWSRPMAMGGVFAATADDASGADFNPATPALAKWTFDIGGTNNRVDDQETAGSRTSYYTGYGTSSQKGYSYFSAAAAGRMGPVVLGLGYSTPYEYLYEDEFANKAEIKITSANAFAGLRFNENLAVGVTGRSQTLYQQFQSSTSSNTTSSNATSWSTGATFRTKKYGVGLVYTPEVKFKSDATKNSGTTTWFRDVTVPSLLVVGGFYRLHERFSIAVDVNRYEVPTNVVDAPSGFSAGTTSDIRLYSGLVQVTHAGFEWILKQEKNMEIIFRGGAYNEPARAVGNESRFHRTYGMQIRFGPAVLNVSFDQAQNFNNTTQGFSLVLGAI